MKDSLHHELVSYSNQELEDILDSLRVKTDPASIVLFRMVSAEAKIRGRADREKAMKITNLARLAKKRPNVG